VGPASRWRNWGLGGDKRAGRNEFEFPKDSVGEWEWKCLSETKTFGLHETATGPSSRGLITTPTTRDQEHSRATFTIHPA
jgi:hypothetical protein